MFLVAPVAEEVVFRAVLGTVMVDAVGVSLAVLITPLFFGVAHAHHAWRKVRLGWWDLCLVWKIFL